MVILSYSAFAQNNLVTYAGNNHKEDFKDILGLSDGTYLVAGYTDNLNWISSGVPKITLTNFDLPNSNGSNRYGIILHFASDLQQILKVLHFPQGAVEDISYIKSTNIPGQTTGDIYISGNTSDTKANGGGFFIAKLNNNFVNGDPTDLEWDFPIWASGNIKQRQPWDVDSKGRVVYMSGQTHNWDWSSIHSLDANGQRRIVDNWRRHWTDNGEFAGTISEYPGSLSEVSHSGIVLKEWGRGDLRSWNQQDFNLVQDDGNGGTKKGKWPLDAFYNTFWDENNPSDNGPGYTGYRLAETPVFGGSVVTIDRRNDHMYLGMNVKSVLPGGNPDFEPAVIAMDETGALKWWSRLYHEITPAGDTVNSSPDQYVDFLAIDYSQPVSNADIVVLARCHGNNVENFWEGNTIAAFPGQSAFQNQFTGSSGNIHISWLGKLDLDDGQLQASTYVAEYANGMNGTSGSMSDPNMDGWPSPNSGWPEVNTTRGHDLEVLENGAVAIVAVGRRTITTSNAFQKMIKASEGSSTWNNFIRIYEPDFSGVKYSTLLVGQWNHSDGKGGDNTDISGVFPIGMDGFIAVGKHEADGNGNAKGNNIPLANVPSWGANIPQNESAILARFYYDDNSDPTSPPQPLAQWGFNNDANDAIGSMDGSLQGGATFSSDAKEGSHSLSLDGNGDLVTLDYDDLEAPFTDRSITGWIKPDNLSGIQTIYEEGGTWKGLTLRLNGSTLEARARENNQYDLDVSATLSGNNWNHVALVKSGATMKLFINGVEQASGSNTNVSTVEVHGNPAGIGGTNNQDAFQTNSTTNFFSGLIDDIRVYTSALTSSEVSDLFNSYSNGTISVTGVSISPTSVSIEEGNTEQINATISPSNATDQSVSWSSSDNAVATVNNNGLVTAVSAGNADITVTTNDGSYTAVSSITVTAAPSGDDYFVESGGLVSIEAEHFYAQAAGTGDASGHTLDIFTDGNASGGEAIICNPNTGLNTGDNTIGPRNDYQVNFSTKGTYAVYLRVLGTSGNEDSYHVGLDGNLLSGGGFGMGSNAGSWKWTDEVTSSQTKVELTISSAGIHTINIWPREDGTQLDKIVITQGDAPSGTGPAESARGGNSTRFSMENQQIARDISIYPNPVENTLYVKLLKGKAEVNIYSQIGRLIRKEVISEGNTGLDVSDLNHDVYFIAVSTEKFKFVDKIIKR